MFKDHRMDYRTVLYTKYVFGHSKGQCLQTILVVMTDRGGGGGMFLVSSGQRAVKLQNVPQCKGQLLPQRTTVQDFWIF